jgi:Asp-tRNA(Asn)/Glu-tRNA(Gln) amidotransferase A subunit family amidase
MARTVRDCVLAYEALTGAAPAPPAIDGLLVGVLGDVPEAQRLEALGARLVPAELPEPEADLVPLFFFECAVAHRGLFPARRDEYGPDTREKWDAARRVPAIDVYEAQRALPLLRERGRTDPPFDLVVCSTLAVDVPPDDCWEPDVRVGLTQNTRPFNNLDWPTMAIGPLQIAGRDEAAVLGAALAWEDAYGPPGASDA